ncbi:MAG: dUTP diphosphatase [Calditrichaeota bacterium]|nr:MAG: dUTP diphosphatase [Calditrichota bacterium]
MNCVVKIKKLYPQAQLPQYAHEGDSGADLFSIIDCVLEPGQRKAIPTGLAAEVPRGFELQVRPKSGLALNYGVTVLNTPGTIDFGYRGEIKVILINLGSKPYPVQAGQKIAQLVVAPVAYADFQQVEELSETDRGSGGFGSTGLQAKCYVAALVLAAGTSSRMGSANKLFLKIKNKTILSHSVENVLASRVSHIMVVVGANRKTAEIELANFKVQVVFNKNYKQGMSTSLKAGLMALPGEATGVLILLADQPNLQPGTINRFVETFTRNPEKIIAGKYQNMVGNPVLFPKKYFSELLQIEGDVGARSVLQKHLNEVITLELPEDEILDIDTPDDFEKLTHIIN